MTKQIQIDNKVFSYTIQGEGQVIVLLHGFGEDSHIWKHQIEHLASKFCIIAPDFAGSGLSSFYEGISIESMASDIYTILDVEGITKACVLGHSMGGYVALAFAQAYSSMLNRFGLIHSTASADNDEKKETRRRGISFVKEHGAYSFLKTMIPKLFTEGFIKNQPSYIEQYTQSLHNFSNESVVSYYEAMINRPDRTEILTQAEIPVLVVLGEHDSIIPLESGLKQAALPNTAYLHILKNSGHMGMVEEANELNTVISHFMDYR